MPGIRNSDWLRKREKKEGGRWGVPPRRVFDGPSELSPASELHFSVALGSYPLNSSGLVEAKGQDSILQESPGSRSSLDRPDVCSGGRGEPVIWAGVCRWGVQVGGAVHRVGASPRAERTKPQEGLEQGGGVFVSTRSSLSEGAWIKFETSKPA